MTINLEDFLKLDEVLTPCVELTSLSLELYRANDALRQKLANDLSLLIGHRPTLKRLVLYRFCDLLVGYWDKYRLPTSLEILVFDYTILMHVDMEHGTDASTTSHIRDLTISSKTSLSDIEGYLKFVESQAETLVSLHIDFRWCEHQPTVDRLKRMAKRLAKFNKLQRFTYHGQHAHDILMIVRDVMPLIAVIQSFNSFCIRSNYGCWRISADDEDDKDILQQLQLAMKKICIVRRRVLDFGTVFLDVYNEEFEDDNPAVPYRDVAELEGYQCHSADDHDPRELYRDGNFYFDNVIPNAND